MPGDFAGHKLPEVAFNDSFATSVNALRNAYPKTPLIYSIGNNDMSRSYSFSCNSKGFEYLYNIMSFWIPEDQKDTFLKFGGYTYNSNGIFFISLNSNAYSYKNNITDDCGQLNWLKQQLQFAKDSNLKFLFLLCFKEFISFLTFLLLLMK